MNSHVLFKPYLYIVAFTGFAIAAWQLFTVPIVLSPQLVIFFMLGIAAELFDYFYEEGNAVLTLGSSNSFFMLVFLPFSAVALSNILSMLALSWILKKKGKYSRIINQKSIYNITSVIIFNYLTYVLIKLLRVSIPEDLLLLGIMVLFQNILNGIMLYTVQSLAMNKSMFHLIFKGMLHYYAYTLLLSVMLVYNYYYMGFWGIAGIYLIFITVQRSMQLKVDNKIKEEKIITDSLTGVYNREFFIRTIDEKLKSKKSFSIIMLDMDDFKKINDTYGHLAGDKVLQGFVDRIRKLLRKEDLLYRYGGDEFTIIVTDANAAEIVERKLYSKKIVIPYKEDIIDIKFSTGIYNCTGKESDYSVVFEKVDAAMYEAKQNGGNQSAYAAEDEFKLS